MTNKCALARLADVSHASQVKVTIQSLYHSNIVPLILLEPFSPDPGRTTSGMMTQPPDFSISIDDDDYEEQYEKREGLDVKRPRDHYRGDEPQSKRKNKSSSFMERRSLLNAPQAGQSRTIYLGGLPEGLEHWDVHHQIFNQIRGAPVEALRLLPAKQCGFIDFFDPPGALAFVQKWEKSSSRKFEVKEKEVKIAWAASSKLTENVQTAIRNGATRNVYLSNVEIDEELDEEDGIEKKKEELLTLFKQFGPVDMVRVVLDRRIAFVHMASVSSAMEAVDVLSARPEWKGHRINFGSDRCGERPPPGQHPSLQVKKRESSDLYRDEQSEEERIPYRTIYIGGLTPEIELEDLCDVIRGGLVQSVRMAPPQKHCAFVTFVDEPSAITFHDAFSTSFLVKGVSLRLGWSKPSPVPLTVTKALQTGATRSIYIGNIALEALGPDPKAYLMEDCTKRFGPVESINVVQAKGIAFVSFCNLLDAVKALAGLRELEEYSKCKLAYGKDRCAQPVRVPFPPTPPPPPSYPPYYSQPQPPYYSPPSYPYPAYAPPHYPSPYPVPYHNHQQPQPVYPPSYVQMVPMPYMVPVYQPQPYPPPPPQPPHPYHQHPDTSPAKQADDDSEQQHTFHSLDS